MWFIFVGAIIITDIITVPPYFLVWSPLLKYDYDYFNIYLMLLPCTLSDGIFMHGSVAAHFVDP
jgi:hypothetical protein